jgi:hypothetical protein
MQTFLPYSDFILSAQCLDYRRLGKQRVETMQIMNVLAGRKTGGWVNHPAVLMWENYEYSLMQYQLAIVEEWKNRGYKDTCLEKTYEIFEGIESSFKKPWWLGTRQFHESHQSNLLRKDFEYYSQFGWKVNNEIEYWWPTKQDGIIVSSNIPDLVQ